MVVVIVSWKKDQISLIFDVDKEGVSFSIDFVVEGIFNMVIFNYDFNFIDGEVFEI